MAKAEQLQDLESSAPDILPTLLELEEALAKVLGDAKVQKILRERDAPVHERNTQKAKLYMVKVKRAEKELAELQRAGVDDPEFHMPEEPEYERTTSYFDLYHDLPRTDQVRVLVEVARYRDLYSRQRRRG